MIDEELAEPEVMEEEEVPDPDETRFPLITMAAAAQRCLVPYWDMRPLCNNVIERQAIAGQKTMRVVVESCREKFPGMDLDRVEFEDPNRWWQCPCCAYSFPDDRKVRHFRDCCVERGVSHEKMINKFKGNVGISEEEARALFEKAREEDQKALEVLK